jgi:hypothetical protein
MGDFPKGTHQRMEVAAGTRTPHVFGGKRANRETILCVTSHC